MPGHLRNLPCPTSYRGLFLFHPPIYLSPSSLHFPGTSFTTNTIIRTLLIAGGVLVTSSASKSSFPYRGIR
ncbi:unnamed protein product [Tuber melanosporum]|uniref:(Perigord truffle) hypothetical protein n=1 Tax=Tuber melanosporum (strain Mel28) TaxID=656061 RepID=D5GFX2_TUBMM|nr:uncharacterized protein GSTUM_00001921001 [Tuber melanosporum]CAZ83415.1 unnamed protein product [Tuber melanosporum]